MGPKQPFATISPRTETETHQLSTLHVAQYVKEKKRVLFVTGTRADFGKLRPLEVALADEGYSTGYFTTGMHLLEEYGNTGQEVRKIEGATIHEFDNHRFGPHPSKVLTETLRGLKDFVGIYQPHLLVVHGDRVEAIAACLFAAQNEIRSVHVEGGELSGSIDELYRHCNTKLSTFHCVSSEAAKKRVVQLGEDPGSVFVIGSPEIDAHLMESDIAIQDVKRKYDIPFEEYGIVTLHSVTTEAKEMGKQAQSLFDCLTDTHKHFVVVKPNNDPGTDQIRKVIQDLRPDRFHIVKSLPFEDFSVLMKNSRVIVGNSSAGVREAPALGVPSLNVGSRQSGRAEDAPSITHSTAFEKEKIRKFVMGEWGKRYPPHFGFGRGSAGQEFVKVLDTPDFWTRALQKRFYEDKSPIRQDISQRHVVTKRSSLQPSVELR